MDKNQRDNLIDKYLRGEATAAEEDILMRWYREQLQADVEWELEPEERAEDVKARIEQSIKSEARLGNVRKVRWIWPATAIAACLIGLLILFGVRNRPKEAVAWTDGQALAGNSMTNTESDGNRFLLLVDSSKVLLRPGSTLEYVNDFEGSSREVRLVGEGYFDIRHDEDRPFIVHTGDIRTVVLGTAFTIKATEGQEVQVTVQRGKVRVEKQEKVLGELVANQQLEVDKVEDVAEQKTVLVEEALAWTAEDMRFDDVAFGQLVDRLERRYGTEISFKNPDLVSCPVSGRFTGAETLEEVLELLCATRNATFVKTEKGNIEINGLGCN